MSDTDFPGAKEALERLRPKLLALPVVEVPVYRFNAAQAVSNLLKVAQAFGEDRHLFIATFKEEAFAPRDFADLDVRGLAVWQADVEWRQHVDAEKVLPGLVEEAQPLEKELFRAADYLWADHPELGPKIAAIRSGQGHLDLADDLMALVGLLDTNWASVEGQTRVKREQLLRARELAAAIAMAYGGREADKPGEARRDLRLRAFHYAHEAAEEIRAAAAYVHRRSPERLEAYPSAFAPVRKASKGAKAARGPKAGREERPTPAPGPTTEPVEG